MASVRAVVAVPTILLCGLLSDARAQPEPADALRPDATLVLDKVRQTYQAMPAYHFERVLLVQEARSDGTLAQIAELTLTTATEDRKPAPGGQPLPPINPDRFRLGTRTRRGEMLQVCGAGTCWSYSPLTKEYMTGKRLRDVSTSVGGSMLMVFHFFPHSMLEAGALQDARVVREEEIEVGKDRRRCYVLEGVITPTPPPSGPNERPSLPKPGLDFVVNLLTLQGLSEGGVATRYGPWPSDEAAGAGEPTQITLWIDRDAHVVVRSTLSAQLYKRTVDNGVQEVERVAVTATDTFTTAAVGAVRTDLFRFIPPDGASEVPNADSRRRK